MKKFLAVFLIVIFLTGCGAPSVSEADPTETTPPAMDATNSSGTSSAELPTMEVLGTPGFGNNDVLALNHYTIMEATPSDSTMTATIAVGGENQDPIFQNRHLQISYWTEYLNFMGSYGSYASMMGMDTSLPLWAQEIDAGKTWEQYFLEFAVEGLGRNYALSRYAEANGISLSPEDQAALDDILLTDGNFAAEYTGQGYTDADSYIQYYFGDGTDAKSYQEYYTMYLLAATCYQAKQVELKEALTEDAILAYYAEHKETFENQGKIQANNINVRHILIQPEGEQDTWTDESWAAAEAAAQALYDQWLADPSEDAFAALATENTMDPGSAETGGLYEEVAPGDMVTEFNAWCFDSERKVGDHGIVKTSYGYHIMYFVGQTETRAWYDTAAEQLVSTELQTFMDNCMQEYPLSVDYTVIRIFDVITANSAEVAG